MELKNRAKPINFLFIIYFIFCSCNEEVKKQTVVEKVITPYSGDLPLGNLNLPDGFKIDVFAEGIDGARSMAMGDDGTLFVGTRNERSEERRVGKEC